MPTQEERITELEQKTVSRIDFLNAISKLQLQHAQSSSDTYHELTILLGVVGSQGRDIKSIKEDVTTLKEDVSALKQDVTTLKEDVGALKERLGSLETKIDGQTTLLTQILARLPEKP